MHAKIDTLLFQVRGLCWMLGAILVIVSIMGTTLVAVAVQLSSKLVPPIPSPPPAMHAPSDPVAAKDIPVAPVAGADTERSLAFEEH